MSRYATAEDTAKLAEKHADLRYNELGNTGLNCSAAGFGAYRVHISVEEHREAMIHALKNGINLIDTSSNYADGGSEELAGSVVNALQQKKIIRREEIIIVSKAGYLQGQNYQRSQQLKQQGRPFPELVEYAEHLEHCIHPEFLEDQLTHSLKRLNLKTVDVYLLHNPEYYLLWAHKQGLEHSKALEEMYRRIEQAFLHLEIEAQNGRINYYGVSSNSFPVAAGRYDFIELEKLWQMAAKISARHKFRVVQFPFNLLEQGAVENTNQSSHKSVMDFCAEHKLAVLTNRPLNAFSEKRSRRLSSIVLEDNSSEKEIEAHFAKLLLMEEQFIHTILPTLKVEEKSQLELSGLFSSAQYLAKRYKELGPYWQWIEHQAQFLTDQVSYAVQMVNDSPQKEAQTIQWLDDYVRLFNALFGQLTLLYGQKTSAENQQIFEKYKNDFPGLSFESLQELAMHSVARIKTVSAFLIGMRRKEYVNDVLHYLKGH